MLRNDICNTKNEHNINVAKYFLVILKNTNACDLENTTFSVF